MRGLRLGVLISVVCLAVTAFAQPPSLEKRDGYIPIYWDAAKGRVLLEIPALNQDLLYFVSLGKGLGSVELGLDRGLGAVSGVVQFRRTGPRVQMIQRNLSYRSGSGGPALQQGIEESFADSILAAMPVEFEANGHPVVDATSLLMRDAAGVESGIRRRGQGDCKLDPARSSVYLAKTKAFPLNTEVEMEVTFACATPGRILASVAPDPRSVTIRQHHSFVKAPDDGYRTRLADARVTASTVSFKDFSRPHTEDPSVRWIRRWRLEKKDPSAVLSEPVKPIVYYLDPSIPESVRTAMREGTLWWNKAFEAAGYRNAMEVRDPEPGMDPMDSRYSYILWVNRDERGFSVGGQFSDPRTGEILVAKPRMDSARIRTISSYWQSYKPGSSAGDFGDIADCGDFFLPEVVQTNYGSDSEASMVQLRQALLTAHEVGHTLGFGHNWMSSINDRASVMEYPSPRLKVTKEGGIDLTESYQKSIGIWDVMTVRYSYTDFPAGKEEEGLAGIVKEIRAKGLLSNPPTDPRYNRYDDLGDPAEYLKETLAQRKILLARYGANVLKPDEPYGNLRGARFWMTYLHHRWAIDSGVKFIGGMYHDNVMKGENLAPTEIVPAALQRRVLGLLMQALTPAELAIPEPLLHSLTVAPYGSDIEDFNVSTGYAFDHLSAARTLSAMVLNQLLEPARAARLVTFADRQEGALRLHEVLDVVSRNTWEASADALPAQRSLRRVVQRVALDAFTMLAVS
ncbi:MAG: zinc-dependent metalloprotease, partial [Bryobacteraceae bacterium]|nr:zinc-dependent metalloprotease [Bryobacteraceae bacterium]